MTFLGIAAVLGIVVWAVSSWGGAGAPEAQSGSTPTASHDPTLVDGAPCLAANVRVNAVTDATSYAAGVQPKLSVTVVNTGTNMCVMDVGTAVQVFSISSGTEVYWRSTDCQTESSSAQVQLQPGKPVSSATPIVWNRTRSSPGACADDSRRQSAPGDGASYRLNVSVNGISSEAQPFVLL